MISVDEARAHLAALVSTMPVETVHLVDAAGRVLAEPVTAQRDQPPFAAASMDGYAIKAGEANLHARFKVIGESAAGHGFCGRVEPGQAVRIFTGAPMPDGTDFVVIQEAVDRADPLICITIDPKGTSNVRPAGGDFTVGAQIAAPRRLRPRDMALLAAMNIARVPVRRKPVVALIPTGDELVMPGTNPGPDQITASNIFGLKAMLDDLGATTRILPIARDSLRSLSTAFDLAAGADLIVTIGGASVGDHDLVATAAEGRGMHWSFYKVRMRPGKPLMAGRLGDAVLVGLPGNPVSAMVCGYVFLKPMIRLMLGLIHIEPPRCQARLSAPLRQNGPREHYMRAWLDADGLTAFDCQDSALLTVLADANALLIRPPDDPPRAAGTLVDYLPL
ncbi:MAG: molybdopterin molybdotransferase MoeA [Rhodobacteraceae bacterium]|nr:molybdopterin molybdotransferase MoeA [Paracoccaceae bacterium]